MSILCILDLYDLNSIEGSESFEKTLNLFLLSLHMFVLSFINREGYKTERLYKKNEQLVNINLPVWAENKI